MRDWLLTLDKEDRKIVGVDIQTVEFGFPIGIIAKCFGTDSLLPEFKS